jgi:hypothetical protein
MNYQIDKGQGIYDCTIVVSIIPEKRGASMFEMLVFIFGVYAFVFGSIRLPWNLAVSGWRARVAGMILMAPLPILILLGRVAGQGVDQDTAMSFYGIMELVIVLAGILGAALFAYLTRPEPGDNDLRKADRDDLA